jgi:hypothetical protein
MNDQPTAGRCPNCETPLSGPYCSSCGQRQLDLDRPFREIAREALDSFFDFDSRIVRTVWSLVSRPGLLTVDFLAGRRARSVHPFKLYFVMSLLLFIGLSFSGYSVVRVGDRGDGPVAFTVTESEPPAEPVGETTETEEAGADEDEDSMLGRSLAKVVKLFDEDPERFNQIFVDRLAKSIIVMVPVFALLLRGLFWRWRYIAHLVFSLHLHSFAFLALVLGIAVDAIVGAEQGQGWGNALASTSIAVYTFLALRRFTGQGRFTVLAKIFVLLWLYLLALVVTMIATLGLTVVTI